MKKILFGILVGALCFANACSDDDDSKKATFTLDEDKIMEGLRRIKLYMESL